MQNLIFLFVCVSPIRSFLHKALSNFIVLLTKMNMCAVFGVVFYTFSSRNTLFFPYFARRQKQEQSVTIGGNLLNLFQLSFVGSDRCWCWLTVRDGIYWNMDRARDWRVWHHHRFIRYFTIKRIFHSGTLPTTTKTNKLKQKNILDIV